MQAGLLQDVPSLSTFSAKGIVLPIGLSWRSPWLAMGPRLALPQPPQGYARTPRTPQILARASKLDEHLTKAWYRPYAKSECTVYTFPHIVGVPQPHRRQARLTRRLPRNRLTWDKPCSDRRITQVSLIVIRAVCQGFLGTGVDALTVSSSVMAMIRRIPSDDTSTRNHPGLPLRRRRRRCHRHAPRSRR